MINNQNLAVLSEKVAYLESAVKNSDEASEISYDNTDSGLTADDVQDAIDEIAPALTAEGTSYDNTDSGLTAEDVQDAIDELNTLSSEVINFTNANCDTAYKIRVAKYGKIVNMSGMIHPTADIAANSVLTNLVPAGYRPNGSVYSTSTNNVILIADDSGNIGLANVSAGLSNGGYYPFNIIFIL